MNDSKGIQRNEDSMDNQKNEADLMSLQFAQDGKLSIRDAVKERPLTASPKVGTATESIAEVARENQKLLQKNPISFTKSPYSYLFKPNAASESNGNNKRIRSKKAKKQKKKIERELRKLSIFRTSTNAFGMETNDLGQAVVTNDTIDNEPPIDDRIIDSNQVENKQGNSQQRCAAPQRDYTVDHKVHVKNTNHAEGKRLTEKYDKQNEEKEIHVNGVVSIKKVVSSKKKEDLAPNIEPQSDNDYTSGNESNNQASVKNSEDATVKGKTQLIDDYTSDEDKEKNNDFPREDDCDDGSKTDSDFLFDTDEEDEQEEQNESRKKSNENDRTRKGDIKQFGSKFNLQGLSDEAKALLEAESVPYNYVKGITPRWKLYDGIWMRYYRELVEFKAQYGHTRMIRRAGRLGEWCFKQRRKYRATMKGQKNRALDSARIELLNHLGFIWNVKGVEDKSNMGAKQQEKKRKRSTGTNKQKNITPKRKEESAYVSDDNNKNAKRPKVEDATMSEKVKENILSSLPAEITEDFRKVCFAKWDEKYFCVLQLSPYDVPPGDVRNQWIRMYNDRTAKGRTMARLVYWYGSDMSQAFSLIGKSKLMSYEDGVAKKLNQIPHQLKMKIEKKIKLSKEEGVIVKNLMAGEVDNSLPRSQRSSWLFDFEEPYTFPEDEEHEVDNVKKGESMIESTSSNLSSTTNDEYSEDDSSTSDGNALCMEPTCKEKFKQSHNIRKNSKKQHNDCKDSQADGGRKNERLCDEHESVIDMRVLLKPLTSSNGTTNELNNEGNHAKTDKSTRKYNLQVQQDGEIISENEIQISAEEKQVNKQVQVENITLNLTIKL